MAELTRSSEASWHGDLRSGKGTITSTTGTLSDTPYTFVSRFEGTGTGTNPEELIAAAHAACFSMALANTLSRKEYAVHHIHTKATVHLGLVDGGYQITKITLDTSGRVDELGEDEFKTAAEETKRTCIISHALSAVPMDLNVTLEH